MNKLLEQIEVFHKKAQLAESHDESESEFADALLEKIYKKAIDDLEKEFETLIS